MGNYYRVISMMNDKSLDEEFRSGVIDYDKHIKKVEQMLKGDVLKDDCIKEEKPGYKSEGIRNFKERTPPKKNTSIMRKAVNIKRGRT
jgi:hypothetical protein